MIEVFEIGEKFKSYMDDVDVVCEIVAVIPELDSYGIQNYVVKVFYEINKFIFDIAEHDVLVECERF